MPDDIHRNSVKKLYILLHIKMPVITWNLSPWSTFLSDQLMDGFMVKKFLTFVGTTRFFATFTTTCLLYIS